jgi:EAL domain-containing protein (putative c-di-GMP-specific phosphodiesterase class I)
VLTDVRTSFTLVGTPYLEYHPVVDLSSGRLLGMEALVRWQHPTEGRIAPDKLIPQAEASGDIGPLTRWILMEACEQANSWSPSIQLGVNCSIHQLRRGDVSQSVAEALEQTGFPGGQLTLEITEDAIVDPEATAQLRNLSQMGVQLSVDDVGTNWSSFELLKRNSISTLKIDGSFIAGLEHSEGINRLVVETVIHMAHSLGMSAIVEMVESASQVEIVRSFSADAAQGFFFAQPMSSEDAATFSSGPEIAQFSLTSAKTLVRPHAAPAGLTVLEADGCATATPTDTAEAATEAPTSADGADDAATDDKAATDKAATDKAATDRAATDRAATDKAATDRAATDNDDADNDDDDAVTSGADSTDSVGASTDDTGDPAPGATREGMSEAVDAAWAEGTAWRQEADSPPVTSEDSDTGPADERI